MLVHQRVNTNKLSSYWGTLPPAPGLTMMGFTTPWQEPGDASGAIPHHHGKNQGSGGFIICLMVSSIISYCLMVFKWCLNGEREGCFASKSLCFASWAAASASDASSHFFQRREHEGKKQIRTSWGTRKMMKNGKSCFLDFFGEDFL